MTISVNDSTETGNEQLFTDLQRERLAVQTRVQMALSLLRKALFAAPPEGCGWTYEALEQYTGKGKSYLHRVLSGVDKCSLEFVMSMPAEAQVRLTELAAEQHGYMVVDAARVDHAMRMLAAYMITATKPASAKASIQTRIDIEVA